MSENWLVLKFGGSSVRGLDQWRLIADRVEERLSEQYRVLLVCSAVAGITDLLHQLSNAPDQTDLIREFCEIHRKLAAELDVEGDRWIQKAEQRLTRTASELGTTQSPKLKALILGTGEWLSTRLGWSYLQKRFACEWVDARGLLQSAPQDGQSERRKWLSAECTPGSDAKLLVGLNGCERVVITQGFVVGLPGGGTAVLGRGGSDTTAVLLGGRISAERVEIWTDVPGLFSADPRMISQARLLKNLDYSEALEMAASGAAVVHPRAVRAAAVCSTTILVRDSARPEVGGTCIQNLTASREGARAVICQDGMVVMLLQNIDPRQQVGFLAEVFGIVAGQGISIDLVATSETTTTIAVNRQSNHLEQSDVFALAEQLRSRCLVKVFEDCVTVNIVGRGVRTALAEMGSVFAGFSKTPLLMVSQSANDLCLSLLVEKGHEEALLRTAHRTLIEAFADDPEFDSSWQEL